MELLFIISIFLLMSGATLYLLVCIDPNSPGILGKLNRFVFGVLPNLLRKIFGDRIMNIFGRMINYFFYSNHPVVQIFYILVSPGGFLIYCVYGFFAIFDNNPEVSQTHTIIGFVLAFYSFYSYYQACHYSPGIINDKNALTYCEEFKEHQDGVLYMPNNICQTCNFIKPPRSKHCRVCNVCVSRFDHHCVWIRQCVGQKNYKYFIKFILLHAILCNYGGWLGIKALYGLALKLNLFNARFRNPVTKEEVNADFFVVFKYLFFHQTMFIFITILCWVMGLTLACFFLYHLTMMRQDTTTNERMKKSDFKEFFKDEIPKLEKQIGQEQDKEKLISMQKKLQRFRTSLSVLKQTKYLGFIGGWKYVFSQPNEIKWIALKHLQNYKKDKQQ